MNNISAWHPHVTVATIVEKDGKYLTVLEHTHSGERYNQPAGHLEKDESLFDAAIRETKEETGYDIELTGLLRVGQFTSAANGVTYIRVSFIGKALELDPHYRLDSDIIKAMWLSKEFLLEHKALLRSPMVLSDIDFYETHTHLPLDYLAIF